MIVSQDSLHGCNPIIAIIKNDHDSESALTIMTVNKVILVRYGTGHNHYCRERGFTIMIASQALLQC